MILVDSGPLVAVGAVNDPHHQVCTELLGSATEELLVPATFTATCLALEQAARAKRQFLPLFPVGKLYRSMSPSPTTTHGGARRAVRHHTEGFTLLPETL